MQRSRYLHDPVDSIQFTLLNFKRGVFFDSFAEIVIVRFLVHFDGVAIMNWFDKFILCNDVSKNSHYDTK